MAASRSLDEISQMVEAPAAVQGACVRGWADIAAYRSELDRLQRVTVVHDLIGRRGPLAPLFRNQVRQIRNGQPVRVLDVGAYDRALERSLTKCGLVSVYHSVDIDQTHHHDFHDIREVMEKYDLICMSELIEHISLENVHELLHRASTLLLPGGKLYISTPNPFHPTRYFGDMTHIQHWPPKDLYGLLRHVGFQRNDIQMYGVQFREQCTLSTLPHCMIELARRFAWRALGLEVMGGLVAIATNGESRL